MNCKYIRTKDGRLFKTKDYFMLPLDYPKFSVYGSDETFYEGHVLGADDIASLCDEFISVRGEWTDHWDDFEECKILCSESDIYGVINGVKVAKLNKNSGVLELL